VETGSMRLSVQYLTGPATAKKMRWMEHIDRRINCAPMTDWTDDIKSTFTIIRLALSR